MATTNINVRVDSELKRSADMLFDELGLSMTSAITMFLRSAVSHEGIPFEVKRVPNRVTRAALAEYDKMKADETEYKRYGSFDELISEVSNDV